jgi:probable HAF family extracellular repeat protein
MTGLALMALAVSAAGEARPAKAGTAYTLKDLGTLGGANSFARGVNNSGQVAGWSDVPGGATHAFLSGPGGGPLQDLGTLLGGSNSQGWAVNNSGQVAGWSDVPGGFRHAFLSDPGGGALKDLGTFVGFFSNSVGYGVNDSGQVAGAVDTRLGVTEAFLSGPGGGPLNYASPGGILGYWSVGWAVNASGQVTGGSYLDNAFLSGPNGGGGKSLGTLFSSDNTTTSVGYAVNASGQVTGASQIGGNFPSNSTQHAFLSGPGGGPLKDLGTFPGGTNSFGFGVNDSGQVVGFSDIAGGADHAFLYSGGQMFDLNSLIAPGSGFTLVQALGISDTGYITGYGTAADGTTHAFLLTPLSVPEPCGLVLLGTGAVGLLGYHGARRRARPRAGRRG